jgi:hypothetical protein
VCASCHTAVKTLSIYLHVFVLLMVVRAACLVFRDGMGSDTYSMVKDVLRIQFGAVAFLIFILPVAAQVRGSYSPGSTLTEGGTLSDAGFSYSNQLWQNWSDRLKGPNGKGIPIQGSISTFFDNNTLSYVPKFKLLGANLEFSADIVIANGNFAARDPFGTGPGISGGGAGLTNTNFVPFDLGWQFKWADIQTGYSVAVPTGRYVVGASDNVNSGFWTNSWQTGATIYLSKKKTTQISVFNVYAWNTVQKGTGVHPGQNDSVDYSLSHSFDLDKRGRWSLLVGAAGYGQWQTTSNRGPNTILDGIMYGVDAAGFTVNLSSPYRAFFVGTSALWEYGARSTYEGKTITITAGVDF